MFRPCQASGVGVEVWKQTWEEPTNVENDARRETLVGRCCGSLLHFQVVNYELIRHPKLSSRFLAKKDRCSLIVGLIAQQVLRVAARPLEGYLIEMSVRVYPAR